MDKLGPIARSIDDCGLVFDVIHGADNADPASVSRWFDWPMQVDLSSLKIGVVTDIRSSNADAHLEATLKECGAALVPVSLPREFSEWAVSLMLDAEAAAVFHPLTEANDTEGLNRWPITFRKLHFLSAVDYLHAARVRSKLMRAMQNIFKNVDLFIGGSDLGISNLTGHPAVVLPTMLGPGQHAQPLCSTLTGRLHDEATLPAVAAIVESAVKVNTKRPDLS